jgi:hypothetical protein
LDINQFITSLGSLSSASWNELIESHYANNFPSQVKLFISEETKLRNSPTINYLLKKISSLQERIEELEKIQQK